MKFITIKKMKAMWAEAETQNQKDKISTIWALASKDWNMERVGVERWKKAEKLYKEVRAEWRKTDLELVLDSREETCGSPRHRRIQKEQAECIENCKRLAEELGLSVYVGTFLHINDGKIM